MKLQTKVLAGTFLMVASVFSFGAVILYHQNSTRDELSRISNLYNRRILLSRELQEQLLRLSRAERNYLLFEDKTYLRGMLNVNLKIESTVQELAGVLPSSWQKYIGMFQSEKKEYDRVVVELIDSVESNKSKADRLARTVLAPKIARMDSLLEEIVKYNQNNIDQAQKETFTHLDRIRLVTFLMACFIAVFSAVGLFLFWRALRTINILSNGIQSVHERHFKSLPVDPSKKDEFSAAVSAFNDMSHWLSGHLEKLNQMAVKDSLTGFFNRRYLHERLEEEIRRSTRYFLPFCLVMIDIDHFKKVNDQYGHSSGDDVLKQVAQIVRSQLRQSDWVARYGGEEFLIFLHNTEKSQALLVADKLRAEIERWSVFLPDHKRMINITISCGLSCYPQDGLNANDLIHRADEALYQAKRRGRNRTEIHGGQISMSEGGKSA